MQVNISNYFQFMHFLVKEHFYLKNIHKKKKVSHSFLFDAHIYLYNKTKMCNAKVCDFHWQMKYVVYSLYDEKDSVMLLMMMPNEHNFALFAFSSFFFLFFCVFSIHQSHTLILNQSRLGIFVKLSLCVSLSLNALPHGSLVLYVTRWDAINPEGNRTQVLASKFKFL